MKFSLTTVCLLAVYFISSKQFQVLSEDRFTPTWAVRIPGDDSLAQTVAKDHKMIYLGKIFGDFHHFKHESSPENFHSLSTSHADKLNNDERVLSAQQQIVVSRQKRYFIPIKNTRANDVAWIDPKWPVMWHLNRGKGHDLNVIPAWEKNITGKGIVVAVVDDGVEIEHRDLEENYDEDASWDFVENKQNPTPDNPEENSHGTSCAGIIAASANNSYCGVGIAYNSRFGGLRIFGSSAKSVYHTDAVEAAAMSFNNQYIDIYSNSWGVEDDGQSLDKPGDLLFQVLQLGVKEGRKKKGSIYVWAAGNGGKTDNCNCDGHANSIYTVAVTSVNEEGGSDSFAEPCSATLTSAFSGYEDYENKIITTATGDSACSDTFSGTSAATPMVSAIIALALEVDPNLTWRDIQHIVIRASNPSVVGDSSEWSKNGAGRQFSHLYGFGLIDASAMVNIAWQWKNVPDQKTCETKYSKINRIIESNTNKTFTLDVGRKCAGIKFLEHVQAIVSIKAQRRGDIEIYLISPAGTRSCLLSQRLNDWSKEGFNEWSFMSVHQWGESSQGEWKLEIHNKGHHTRPVTFTGWNLALYGTETLPGIAFDETLKDNKVEDINENEIDG